MTILIVTTDGLVEEEWLEVRERRDALIAQTDWVMMPDAPLSAETKESYLAYRQALRDLPQAYSSAEEVVWPLKPGR
ncbi:phage tail assembly chaperone [Vibrio sp. Isolate32]|uniref:tail fiber assembly protein n=1 Tax=Vibrio sp. Isolate32 TaxID=2908538 RepID=UPI001EFE95F9|nr:tail fiber assembly protein [Vibrio sp. Isolate32]MCG9552699.1 phage tail assembly chaperone [Vibrio sp. Isolate32]